MLAPEFTIVDHRQLGVPMDRAAYLESLRVLIEQAPDFTFFFAKPHVEGNVAITPVPFFGTTPEGSRYEWSYVQVAVADTDGPSGRVRVLRRRPVGRGRGPLRGAGGGGPGAPGDAGADEPSRPR